MCVVCSLQTASEGEVRAERRRVGRRRDPFDRFLANLRPTSSPSTNSSTPLSVSSRDQTLSDLPSIAREDSLSSGEVRDRHKKSSTPLRPRESGRELASRGGKSIGEAGVSVLPYHRRFPLEETKSASPGEVRAGERKITESLVHSEGELHPDLRERAKMKDVRRPLPSLVAASSPGEVRLRPQNKTRDGIDVIRVSKRKSNSPSKREGDTSHGVPSQDSAAFLPNSFPSSLSDSPSLAQPHHSQEQQTVRRRLRVSSELVPILTVSPAPLAQTSERSTVDSDKVAESSNEPTPSGSKRDEETVKCSEPGVECVSELPSEVEVSPDATRPPPLESLLQTSPSQETPPLTPPPHQAEPPSNHTKSEAVLPAIQSGIEGLRSFWDSPHLPPLTSSGTQLSPRTQLRVAVPTGMMSSVGEESSTTSHAPSPAYSSDFDFSSVSQPTFD